MRLVGGVHLTSRITLSLVLHIHIFTGSLTSLPSTSTVVLSMFINFTIELF